MSVFCLKKQLTLPFYRATVYSITKWTWIILLYGWLPIPLLYVQEIDSDRKVAGKAKFFSILIERRYCNDISLIVHEVTHIHQIFRTLWFHFFFYNFFARYRYRAELEAYCNQCIFLLTNGDTYDNWVAINQLIEWVSSTLHKHEKYVLSNINDKEIITRDFSMLLIKKLKKYKKIKAKT